MYASLRSRSPRCKVYWLIFLVQVSVFLSLLLEKLIVKCALSPLGLGRKEIRINSCKVVNGQCKSMYWEANVLGNKSVYIEGLPKLLTSQCFTDVLFMMFV